MASSESKAKKVEDLSVGDAVEVVVEESKDKAASARLKRGLTNSTFAERARKSGANKRVEPNAAAKK